MSNATSIVPWSPVPDAIEPILAALDALIAMPVAELHQNIGHSSTAPSHALGEALGAPRGGGAARADMLTRWLQSNGFEADADETRRRLAGLRENLRAWEDSARESLTAHLGDVAALRRAGRPVEAIDRLGDDARDAFDALTDAAQDTREYLTQLGATLGAKLGVTSDAPADSADTPLSPTQQNILIALLEGNATDSDSHVSADEVVRKAFGSAAYANDYKRELSALVKNGLTASKQGRGGGYWLTPVGAERAAKLATLGHDKR